MVKRAWEKGGCVSKKKKRLIKRKSKLLKQRGLFKSKNTLQYLPIIHQAKTPRGAGIPATKTEHHHTIPSLFPEQKLSDPTHSTITCTRIRARTNTPALTQAQSPTPRLPTSSHPSPPDPHPPQQLPCTPLYPPVKIAPTAPPTQTPSSSQMIFPNRQLGVKGPSMEQATYRNYYTKSPYYRFGFCV